MKFEITVSQHSTSMFEVFKSLDDLFCSDFVMNNNDLHYTVCLFMGSRYVYSCNSLYETLTLIYLLLRLELEVSNVHL